MTTKAEVIVVGAGPGGSAAAYHAARGGLDVILLDRQEFPRDKPCGDALMPHASSEVALMGLSDWLSEPSHGRFRGLSLYTQSARFGEALPPTFHGTYGYVVPRVQTDAKLLEVAKTAGARFYEGVRVTDILRSADGSVVGVEAISNGDASRYEAPLAIVADGSGGSLAGERKARQNVVARRQYLANVTGPDQNHLHIFATEDMNEKGAGYGWVCYFGDGRANVGAGVSTQTLARTGRNLKDFFNRFLEEPMLAEWLKDSEPVGPPKSWSLKTGIWGAKRAGQGLMLVGDAGSLIHPISGEGVGYAMESGRLAAAFAHDAHARRDFSAKLLAGYERGLRRQRAREHLSGLALINALPNLAILEPLFKVGEQDRNLRQTFIEIFTSDAPVCGLLRHPRVLRTLLFRTATQ